MVHFSFEFFLNMGSTIISLIAEFWPELSSWWFWLCRADCVSEWITINLQFLSVRCSKVRAPPVGYMNIIVLQLDWKSWNVKGSSEPSQMVSISVPEVVLQRRIFQCPDEQNWWRQTTKDLQLENERCFYSVFDFHIKSAFHIFSLFVGFRSIWKFGVSVKLFFKNLLVI